VILHGNIKQKQRRPFFLFLIDPDDLFVICLVADHIPVTFRIGWKFVDRNKIIKIQKTVRRRTLPVGRLVGMHGDGLIALILQRRDK